eukprot:gene5517-9334_t
MHTLTQTLSNSSNRKSLTLKYGIDELNFEDESKKKFLLLSYDDETKKFFTIMQELSYTHQLSIILGKPILNLFYSVTDTNSILDCGHMFLFSSDHLKKLFGKRKFENHLDIGAGCGLITEKFKPFCKNISCTETSLKMIETLKEKHFNVYENANIDKINQNFDLITCLNVLDRCEYPLNLLKEMKKKLRNEARILIALVCPVNQKVEGGHVQQRLIKNGQNFEKSVGDI